MVWHPGLYAEILAKKLQKHKADCWLVNTGWTGGGYGEGQRMSLPQTRSIIDAIHNGSLARAEFETHEPFGLAIPKTCAGVPEAVLDPRKSWNNDLRYFREANRLAHLFESNFAAYAPGVSLDVRRAGPSLDYAPPPLSKRA
jgi:phosphoenolpyruvate carboxykinase (ATP)